MAIRIGYVTSSAALLHPAEHAKDQAAAFFADWEPAIDNREHRHGLLCAEMSRLAYADERTIADVLPRARFRLVTFFGAADDAGAKRAGTQGFVAESEADDLTVLAFRGTESKLADVLADAGLAQEPFGNARVHGGFKSRYAPVQERVKQLGRAHRGKLLITGHSLGAALATLAAVDAEPAALVTFGSPLVGNGALQDPLRAIVVHRYVGCCDVVTRVPPPRFDPGNVGRLLVELFSVTGPATAAIKITARALAPVLARLFSNPQYAHVGEQRYLNEDGTFLPGATPIFIDGDQARARRAYVEAHGRFIPPVSLADLAEILDGADDLDVALPALRRFFASFTSFRGPTVPLRDLADHAPINYVSALAGRLPTAEPLTSAPLSPTPSMPTP